MVDRTGVVYCRDCVFGRNRYAQEKEYECHAPQNLSEDISLVTGTTRLINPSALFQRVAILQDTPLCGASAKWFRGWAEHRLVIAEEGARRDAKLGLRAPSVNSKLSLKDL